MSNVAGQVHDCRQAIDQDPKIFKAVSESGTNAILNPAMNLLKQCLEAHLDAASFHSSLCEDGTRFCDAGLQQASQPQYDHL